MIPCVISKASHQHTTWLHSFNLHKFTTVEWTIGFVGSSVLPRLNTTLCLPLRSKLKCILGMIACVSRQHKSPAHYMVIWFELKQIYHLWLWTIGSLGICCPISIQLSAYNVPLKFKLQQLVMIACVSQWHKSPAHHIGVWF